jgi:hypothetical protein
MKTKHEELKSLVTELYQEHDMTIEPIYPRILVRVLPREQQTKGRIILPEFKQNKPTEEGIVIQVYKPFWQTISKIPKAYENDFEIRNKAVELDEKGYPKKVWNESPVQPGDHVVFPHMAFGIVPVWPLDDGKGNYKMIPEWEILATVKYQQEGTLEYLAGLLDDLLMDGIDEEEMASEILNNFDIIRKDVKPVVISGK